jgi:hypothetical protein
LSQTHYRGGEFFYQNSLILKKSLYICNVVAVLHEGKFEFLKRRFMKVWFCRFMCYACLYLLAFLPSLGLAFDDFSNQQDSIQMENDCTVNIQEFYVTIDQIILCPEGIFVNLENIGVLPIYSLTRLESNLFFIKAANVCPKHGQYCPTCGGCAPWNRCLYRCKCPQRP